MSSVSYDAMWYNMYLIQIIDGFRGQTQGSSGQTATITRSIQGRGLRGWNLPHLFILTSNFPSFSSEYKQRNHALEGSRASGG